MKILLMGQWQSERIFNILFYMHINQRWHWGAEAALQFGRSGGTTGASLGLLAAGAGFAGAG